VLPSHVAVAQSVPVVHAFPSAHFVAHVPPQSMSVSAPFLEPSVQVGVAPLEEPPLLELVLLPPLLELVLLPPLLLLLAPPSEPAVVPSPVGATSGSVLLHATTAVVETAAARTSIVR
jgi:hypothetical protein